MHLAVLAAQVGEFPLAVFLVGNGVVVVDNRNRALLLRAEKEPADVFALLRVVEVLMFHQHLTHGIFLPDEVAVLLHQDALSLRRVVRFRIHAVARQLVPRALDVIQTSDFRRAARHPDHAGLQLAAQPRKNVVIDVGVFAANQRHRANLADQIKIVLHVLSFFLQKPFRVRLGRCPKPC